MKELVTDFDVVFRCESLEMLDNFLLSYEDSPNMNLLVVDISDEGDLINERIESFRFKGSAGCLRIDGDAFSCFKQVIEFDWRHKVFNNPYVVFCSGIQFFDDTLKELDHSVSKDKCFVSSPMSVDYFGEFKIIDNNFNEDCFVVNRTNLNQFLDKYKISSFEDFVEKARKENLTFSISNCMVFV